ncbi:hypothetical protein GGS21DRAFT_215407 [Xylaria nigripes]|nr:hypothetical protein GGS21DRAFT_215407 [Xylaria nigripes]
MSETPSQNEVENYMLPSTFSPWRGGEPASSSQGNTSNSTKNNISVAAADLDLTRPSIDSTTLPSPVQSIAISDISGPTLRPPASSTLHMPQSEHLPTTQPYTPTRPLEITMSHTASMGSNATAETTGMERQSTRDSTSGTSSLAQTTEVGNPAISNVDAERNTAIMPTHPGAESIPLAVMYTRGSSLSTPAGGDGGSANNCPQQQSQPSHFDCYSREDVYNKRWSHVYVTLVVLSIYSTVLSGIWLGLSIVQPPYGRFISTAEGWQLKPSTSTLIATLAAKTIELSFVTIFVAVLGQVLTRRAFSRLSRGVNLAEMTMRNWVIQPGSLLTHWQGISYAAPTVLGGLTLTAALCALLYTTASDAMVSPKLKRLGWQMMDMQGLVKASYANPYYVSANCETPLNKFDVLYSPEACLDVLFSGQSYNSLIAFMAEWEKVSDDRNERLRELKGRPTGKHNLFENTTMDSSWIETQYADATASFDVHKRIVNNVTLAMPHPGVYTAARDPKNGILQPNELLGVGEYSIRASVVSPVVNVMCVNLNRSELSPLIYTEWPHARVEFTDIPGQVVGQYNWQDDVPVLSPTEFLNRTVVDDIFKWGEKYGRRPPVFPLFPIDYNMITNVSTSYTDPLYLLAKSGNISDYTVCELRSWVTPKCSTSFDLSGTQGGKMKANCEDPNDKNTFERVYPEDNGETPSPSGDWRNVAEEWRLSINLNAGVQNSNASNARVLTSLILQKPGLNPLLPSMAEAVAVLATSTLVAGSQDSTFKPVWTYNQTLIKNGVYENFRAEVQSQQYASAHTETWQAIFYPVLALVFILNVLCLLYLMFGSVLTSAHLPFFSSRKKGYHTPHSPSLPLPVSYKTDPVSDSEDDEMARKRDNLGPSKAAKGLVTDYTEPWNLFALAVNSPASCSLAGSCGAGPNSSEMGVPWRVGYVAGQNHYFVEEVRREGEHVAHRSGVDAPQQSENYRNYKRLSTRQAWL